MPRLSVLLGLALILLGVVGYIATGMVSVTALIPAFFGIVFALLGFLGRKEALRKHVMHGAAVLALISLFPTARGLGGAIALLRGEELSNAAAAISQALMFILCLAFLLAAVKSFIDARKAREQAGPTG